MASGFPSACPPPMLFRSPPPMRYEDDVAGVQREAADEDAHGNHDPVRALEGIDRKIHGEDCDEHSCAEAHDEPDRP